MACTLSLLTACQGLSACPHAQWDLSLQLEAFLGAWQNAQDGVLRTGSYLSYVGPDGVLRNAANAALLARIFTGYNPHYLDNFDCWAEYQARALVGDGQRSYLVGTQHSPPTQAQHRVRPPGSAIPKAHWSPVCAVDQRLPSSKASAQRVSVAHGWCPCSSTAHCEGDMPCPC